jgi:hypothetical protein
MDKLFGRTSAAELDGESGEATTLCPMNCSSNGLHHGKESRRALGLQLENREEEKKFW